MPVSYRAKDDRYLVSCDKVHCMLNIAVNTAVAATELEQEHECPVINGHTKYAGSVTMTLVEDMWEKADAAYTEFTELELADPVPIARLKGALRMAAEMIVIFMGPHFQTADEIVREIVKRKQMRDSGEPYETKGLGYRMYELPKDDKKQRPVQPKPVVPSKLSKDDIAMIRYMKDNSTHKELAGLFSITEAEVQAVLLSG